METMKKQSHTKQAGKIMLAAVSLSLASCSSMEKSVTLGVASGLAIGTTGSLIGGGSTETTLVMAGLGALIGGIASNAIHGSLDKRDDVTRRDTLFNLGAHGITPRAGATKSDLSDVNELITNPEVEEEWVDTHTEGSKLIEGHRVFNITSGAMWDLSRKPEKKRKK